MHISEKLNFLCGETSRRDEYRPKEKGMKCEFAVVFQNTESPYSSILTLNGNEALKWERYLENDKKDTTLSIIPQE